MPFKVSMRVTGLREIISGLENVTRQDFHATKVEILTQGADLFVDTAKFHVHYITGKTHDSIEADPVSNDGNSVIIHSEYGGFWEEKRGEDHAFMSAAAEKVEKVLPTIIIREFEKMWRKNRSSVPVGSKFG